MNPTLVKQTALALYAMSLLTGSVIGCVEQNDMYDAGTDSDAGTEHDTEGDTEHDTEGDTEHDTEGDGAEECIPHSYTRCNEDGDVVAYDSCDAPGPVVRDCHDENAECVDISEVEAECRCLNQWQGDDCDHCPGNWNPEAACATCLPGFAGADCDACVRFVVAGAPPQGADGLTWGTAFGRVARAATEAGYAAAEDSSLDGCEVWVAAGIHYVYQASVKDTVEIPPGVGVFGGFSGDEIERGERDPQANLTVLDGRPGADGTQRVRHVVTAGSGAVLDGLTVRKGRASGDGTDGMGGGLLIIGGSPLIADCRFADNEAEVGGAVYASEASPTFIDCRFENNTAALSGGAVALHDGQGIIENCSFIENEAGTNGGALRTYRSNASITECVFQGNQAEVHGGAVANEDGAPVFSGCVFAENQARTGGGGGVFNYGGEPIFDGCRFTDNVAGQYGGGVRNVAGAVPSLRGSIFMLNLAWEGGGAVASLDSDGEMVNCLVAANAALGTAGGSAVHAGNSSLFISSSTMSLNYSLGNTSALRYVNSSDAMVVNTIVHGNTPADLRISTSTVTVTYSLLGSNHEGAGNISGDPLFVDVDVDSAESVESLDFRLAPGSPCIDAGLGTVAPPFDIDGNPRVDDPDVPNTGGGAPDYVDIGAYERQP